MISGNVMEFEQDAHLAFDTCHSAALFEEQVKCVVVSSGFWELRYRPGIGLETRDQDELEFPNSF